MSGNLKQAFVKASQGDLIAPVYQPELWRAAEQQAGQSAPANKAEPSNHLYQRTDPPKGAVYKPELSLADDQVAAPHKQAAENQREVVAAATGLEMGRLEDTLYKGGPVQAARAVSAKIEEKRRKELTELAKAARETDEWIRQLDELIAGLQAEIEKAQARMELIEAENVALLKVQALLGKNDEDMTLDLTNPEHRKLLEEAGIDINAYIDPQSHDFDPERLREDIEGKLGQNMDELEFLRLKIEIMRRRQEELILERRKVEVSDVNSLGKAIDNDINDLGKEMVLAEFEAFKLQQERHGVSGAALTAAMIDYVGGLKKESEVSRVLEAYPVLSMNEGGESSTASSKDEVHAEVQQGQQLFQLG